MNSMVATMPWTIPAPIGIIVATGFAPLSFLYVALALILDVLIWLPFFRAYDDGILKEEQAKRPKNLLWQIQLLFKMQRHQKLQKRQHHQNQTIRLRKIRMFW